VTVRFTTAVATTALRQDLEALQIGLGRELTALKRSAAETLARSTRANTPLGPGPQSPHDALPHIRDTITARAAGVVSTHPAALVHEFGGTIAPRGVPIRIPRREMAARALRENATQIERDLAAAVERLIATNVR
jgi:hypothetical protein